MLNRVSVFFCTLGVVLLFGCTPVAVEEEATAADRLHRLFADEWSLRSQRDPLLASSSGITDYNDRLPEMTADAQQRALDEDLQFMERLAAIDSAALSEDDRTNYALFEFVLGHRTTLAKYRQYRIPISSDSGFHIRIQRMHEAMPFQTIEDYERYLSRLRAIGPFFAQNIDNMRAGLADGFTLPRAILDGVVSSISGAIVDSPQDSIFFAPLRSIPEYLSTDDAERLRSEANAAIAETVVPAYREFLQFFTGEYMSGARESLGASSLEDGRAYYEDLTRYFTSLDDAKPDELHELGLREVARIRGEMDEIIEQVEFDGTFAEFIDYLRTDSQFYVDDPGQLLKEASYIAKKVDGRMPAFFRTMPRMPYGVMAVPDDIAPNYTTGRYWQAPVGGRRGGYYLVNTYALDKRPLYELAALTVHEGVPGHHHQIALRQEMTQLPEFRRALSLHAFVEGWGLYCEKLGIEMDIYATPYDHFGRLSYEMWRAVRLVVDTGIHYKGWTRDGAQQYLAENSALSLQNVRTEIDRYISWPGQALAYKMGEMKFLELRARAADELGEEFDIRDFHDAILMTGGVPLDMLDREIDRFIESVRTVQ